MNKTWMKYVLTFVFGAVIASVLCSIYFIDLLSVQQQYMKELSNNNINHYKYIYSERAESLIELSNAYSQHIISDSLDDEKVDISNVLVGMSMFLSSVTHQEFENKKSTFNTMLFFYSRTRSSSDRERSEKFMKEIINYCEREVYYENCSRDVLENVVDKIVELDSLSPGT